MLQVKADIGRLVRPGQRGQQLLGRRQRQLGIDRVVFAGRLVRLHADARDFGHKNQLVGLQLGGHAGGHFFHGQVESFPSGRKTKGGKQNHRAHVQRAHDAVHIHLAHQARVDEIHAVHNAHRPGRDEVARQHPHGGARHGRVGQTLAESGFDLVAQLASSFLGAVQSHAVGDADAVGIFGRVALGGQLFVDLGAKAVHQHDFHAHALDQRQVLRQVLQLARGNGLARDAHHKGLAPVHVDVRRHRPEPGHEGEVENCGHGQSGTANGAECRAGDNPGLFLA